jgi:hypothetical protein
MTAGVGPTPSAVVGAWLVHLLVFGVLGRVTRRLERPLAGVLVAECRGPARALLPCSVALHVTERTLELLVIVSAPNADALGDLRADVRERLVDFLQQRYPECLPRLRADLGRPDGATGPTAAPDPADTRRADNRSA